MSIKVIRYRPAYFSGFDEESKRVSSIEELFNIPWIKNWSEEKRFYRFSLSDEWLMCELDEGGKWYVVAKMCDSKNRLGLPVWNRRGK